MISQKPSSKETSNEKIKVVVRVRPLNAEERIRGHQNVIQIEESQPQTITIWDPTGIDAMTRPELQNIDPSCWARNFSYDCCIHSSSADESHASQEHVFDIVGQPVINWAIDGFNSCVLAYGQTGAGKSFTMMGNESPAEFGLIPRICFGLFEHFETFENDPDVDCSMEFSFVEIYNESLR
jgi:kinesin family member 1